MSKPKIVYFDTETTSNDKFKAEIIQLAIIGPDFTYEQKFRPLGEISQAAIDVHGMTAESLQNEPTFREKAKEILPLLSNCVLAGYGIAMFDIPVISRQLDEVGICWPPLDVEVLEVSNIYKKLNPRSLSDAYKKYVGKEPEAAHDALYDTQMTIEVFQGMFNNEKAQIGENIEDFIKFSKHDETFIDIAGKFIWKNGVACYNFGNYKDQPVKDSIDFLFWMLGKDFPLQTKAYAKKFIEEYNAELAKKNAERQNQSESEAPMIDEDIVGF